MPIFVGAISVTATGYSRHKTGKHTGKRRLVSRQPALDQEARMRLGAPVFIDELDFEAQALEHVRKGYRAAYCPQGVSLADSAGIAQAVAAYKKHDIVIAEVGIWNNVLDPDPAKAAKAVAYSGSQLALADALGARCAVNIIGSHNPDNWAGAHPAAYTEAFFEQCVETARHIIDQVKPKRTKLTFEMMPYQFLDGPDEYIRLLKAIDRPAAGVHLDICNCVNSPRRYYANSLLIEETFKKLGRAADSCHLKDIMLYDEGTVVQFREVTAGEGGFDIKKHLDCARSYGDADLPVMLEHLANEALYDKAFAYVASL
jgi:sugar phosphate isomerase/epimerase